MSVKGLPQPYGLIFIIFSTWHKTKCPRLDRTIGKDEVLIEFAVRHGINSVSQAQYGRRL